MLKSEEKIKIYKLIAKTIKKEGEWTGKEEVKEK